MWKKNVKIAFVLKKLISESKIAHLKCLVKPGEKCDKFPLIGLLCIELIKVL